MESEIHILLEGGEEGLMYVGKKLIIINRYPIKHTRMRILPHISVFFIPAKKASHVFSSISKSETSFCKSLIIHLVPEKKKISLSK